MVRESRATGRRDPGPLPAPGVRFGADFRARLESCVHGQVRGGGREAAGLGSVVGAGVEVEGRRPYRPGEDVRTLDWELLARDDRPFVRTLRREAGVRWGIAIDTSASMGLGRPGKLQAAAELAGGLCAVGLASGVEVVMIESGAARGDVLRRPTDLERGLAFLEGLVASGDRGVEVLGSDPRWRGTDTLHALGDALPSKPGAGWPEFLPFARPGRRVGFLQVLSPEERGEIPGAPRDLIYVDPERGAELEVAIDPELLIRYRRELERWTDAARRALTRMGARLGLLPTDGRFEDILAEWLR